jgi:hypothetical protein
MDVGGYVPLISTASFLMGCGLMTLLFTWATYKPPAPFWKLASGIIAGSTLFFGLVGGMNWAENSLEQTVEALVASAVSSAIYATTDPQNMFEAEAVGHLIETLQSGAKAKDI